MSKPTIPMLLKSFAVIILLVMLAALVWASQPFIDRSKKGAAPVPFSRAPDALTAGQTARLIDFVENRAAGTEALLIVKNGQLIFEYGPTDVPSNLHSIRKSVLSVLFGIAREKQLLDINATLAELGIDEPAMPLTDIEKSATVAMLLQARSGIYLTSGAETQQMKDGRPARGQFLPGEHYYYNNWDFNVLGTIFELETGLSIGNALDQWLAQPLGMQDYHPSHVIYDTGTADTQYPTYRIHMSGRDLARIGLLIQNKGKWGAEQIVPADWVALTTARVSKTKTRAYDGYGYLWWLNSERDVIAADGWGGQYLQIDRSGPYVLVNRQDTGNSPLGYLQFVYSSHYDDPLDLYKIHDILTSEQ